LGDFIRIIYNSGTIYNIPRKIADRNIAEYYVNSIRFGDYSSFNGANPTAGTGSTISLSEFLRDRYISTDRAKQNIINGLCEIKYLSFSSLNKLIEAARKDGLYDVFNFSNNKRESMPMKDFLKNLLKKDIIQEILEFNNKDLSQIVSTANAEERNGWGCNIS
jgi:hypothetical protein